MSILYMIRHGQASFGKENYDKLSDLGNYQAKLLSKHFLQQNLNFDLIYTGTMVRQIETAGPLLEVLRLNGLNIPEVRQLNSFNEYDFEKIMKLIIPLINIESMLIDKLSFQNIFEIIMMRWITGIDKIPDLPLWTDFIYKITEEINNIMKNSDAGKKIAVFTSGGPIASVIQKSLCLSDEITLKITWQIANSSVTTFKFTEDKIMLSTFNDYNHLKINGSDDFITFR